MSNNQAAPSAGVWRKASEQKPDKIWGKHWRNNLGQKISSDAAYTQISEHNWLKANNRLTFDPEWLDESPSATSAPEGESELIIIDTINNDQVPVSNLEEAKKYIRENYIDGNEAHPDLGFFAIMKQVGYVGMDAAGHIGATYTTPPYESGPFPEDSIAYAQSGFNKPYAELDKESKLHFHLLARGFESGVVAIATTRRESGPWYRFEKVPKGSTFPGKRELLLSRNQQ